MQVFLLFFAHPLVATTLLFFVSPRLLPDFLNRPLSPQHRRIDRLILRFDLRLARLPPAQLLSQNRSSASTSRLRLRQPRQRRSSSSGGFQRRSSRRQRRIHLSHARRRCRPVFAQPSIIIEEVVASLSFDAVDGRFQGSSAALHGRRHLGNVPDRQTRQPESHRRLPLLHFRPS